MTDLATALASHDLSDFEGLHVVSSGIEIPGAAGGLQPAMKIEPQEFRQGDTVHVVFRCEVGKIRHEPIVKDELRGAQRRVHVFKVTDATIVDGAVVQDAIDAQRIKIAVAKEEAARLSGSSPIPGLGWEDDPETEALVVEHNDGQHPENDREGCPSCAAEVAGA